jgi:DNA-directed RNA polymerase subunit RPC12/RpoP
VDDGTSEVSLSGLWENDVTVIREIVYQCSDCGEQFGNLHMHYVPVVCDDGRTRHLPVCPHCESTSGKAAIIVGER